MVNLKGKVKTLGIDLDETAMNFLDPIFDYYKGRGVYLTRKDLKFWNMEHVGIEKSSWLKPGFFRSLKPFPNVVEVLSYLNNYFEIIIVTDAKGVDFVIEEKTETIKKYFPFVKDVFFGSDKFNAPCDLLFDDSPYHLEKFRGITVKMFRPYNAKVPTDFVVYNTDWLKFERLCVNINVNN